MSFVAEVRKATAIPAIGMTSCVWMMQVMPKRPFDDRALAKEVAEFKGKFFRSQRRNWHEFRHERRICTVRERLRPDRCDGRTRADDRRI
jgi:hypothetical protein